MFDRVRSRVQRPRDQPQQDSEEGEDTQRGDQVDRWIDGLMDWWIDGLMDWWIDGLINWWNDGLMDWLIDGLID